MSVWGRDAAIERMALFRQSEIWQVTPDLARAAVVELKADGGLPPPAAGSGHRQPGPGPDHLRFLV